MYFTLPLFCAVPVSEVVLHTFLLPASFAYSVARWPIFLRASSWLWRSDSA